MVVCVRVCVTVFNLDNIQQDKSKCTIIDTKIVYKNAFSLLQSNNT